MIYDWKRGQRRSFKLAYGLFSLFFVITLSQAAKAGSDSSIVSPPTIVMPSLVMTTPTLQNPCADAGGALVNNNNGCMISLNGPNSPGAGGINIDGGEYSYRENPARTYFNSSNSGYDSTFTVPYSGTYLVIVNLTLQQTSRYPVFYWIDGWIATNDNNNQSTPYSRFYYSGDSPSILNVGNAGTVWAYFSSIVHLSAGGGVWAPRIWASCPPDQKCGSFTVMPGPASASCSMTSSSCMFIYLLQSP